MSEELDRNGVLLAFARTTAFVVANPEIQRRALQEILDSEVTDEEKVSQLLLLADDIEGQLDDANSDWPLLYEIISDDEDGSDSGPWASSVFGTRDLWLEPKFKEKVDKSGFFQCSSIEYDDTFFNKYCSAVHKLKNTRMLLSSRLRII